MRSALPDGLPGRIVAAVRLRWSTLLLAMAATVVVALRRWRTWSTGDRTGGVEFHAYWPWYVWSHTDHVIGPNAGLLLASFLTGVVVWYLPAALVTGVVRDVVGRVGVTRLGASLAPAPLLAAGRRLAAVARLRPWRTVGVVLLMLVVGVVPLVGYIVLLPGIALVSWGLGIPYESALVPTDFANYLYVPVSVVGWCLTASVLLAAKRWVGDAVAGRKDATSAE